MRLLTGRAAAGVAVVVAEDDADRARVLPCLQTSSGQPLSAPAPGAPPRLARLVWDGSVRDEVLVVERGAGGLELHQHGGPSLLAAFQAQFGLFASAETPVHSGRRPTAEQLLRRALCPEQLLLAAEQRQLPLVPWLAGLDTLLPAERRAQLQSAIARSAAARAMVEPCRLVLVGRQNAGKSTLLNRLVFRERVLVGDVPGLTRDAVSEVTTLCGYPVEIVDTAGEGSAGSAADAAAIEQGRSERAAGQLALVVNGVEGIGDWERQWLAAAGHRKPLVLLTRGDLIAGPEERAAAGGLWLDCASAESASRVRQAVGELLLRHRGLAVAGAAGGLAALDERELQALHAALAAAV